MSLNKLFSKSAFLLLLSASLVACDTGVDATGQADTDGAIEEDVTLREDADGVMEEDVTLQEDADGVMEEDVTLQEDAVDEEAIAQADAEGNVTTEDVAEDIDELIGQTVTIRSDALEVIEPAAFVVADQEFFGGEDIIVLNATGEAFVLPETDAEVQITGEVTEFVIADVESAYDLDIDPDLYVEYENQPAIIAQSMALAPEPGEIAADPTQYYGQTLAVTGEVENIYGLNTFTLDEEELFGGEDLLVVVPNSSQAVTDGETVAVTGQLRSLVLTELERDYDLTWDLDIQQEIEAEYSNRPVLVVDQIYPSAIPGMAK